MGTNDRPALVIANRLWLPASETFVAHHASALTRWSPHILALKRTDADAKPNLTVSTTCLQDSLLAELLFQFFGVSKQAANLFETVRPQLVHVHFLTTAVVMLPFLERMKVQFVVTAHGYDATVREFSGSVTNWAMKHRLGRVFAKAERVLCVSDYIRKCVIERGCPEHKAPVHYLGIPIPPLIRRERRRSRVLFVGRLVPKKGILKLIRAASKVRETGEQLDLRVIGDGPERLEAQELSTQLNVPVEWLGWQRHDRVLEEMAEAQIFCMPSSQALNGDNEGFGIVYLEAQAMQTPVVAFDQGPVPEAVEDGVTGLLARDGDIEHLAVVLRSLLENPKAARAMGEAGRERVEKSFDIAVRTRVLETLYDECSYDRHQSPQTIIGPYG